MAVIESNIQSNLMFCVSTKHPEGKTVNSHFGQSVHALEDIFWQRLKVVVSQTPEVEREIN